MESICIHHMNPDFHEKCSNIRYKYPREKQAKVGWPAGVRPCQQKPSRQFKFWECDFSDMASPQDNADTIHVKTSSEDGDIVIPSRDGSQDTAQPISQSTSRAMSQASEIAYNHPLPSFNQGFIVQPIETIKVDNELPYPVVVKLSLAGDLPLGVSSWNLWQVKFSVTLHLSSTGKHHKGLTHSMPIFWRWKLNGLIPDPWRCYTSPLSLFIVVGNVKIAHSGQFFLRVGTKFEGASGKRYEGRFYDSKPIFVSPPQQCVDASYGEFLERRSYMYLTMY